MVEAMIFEIKTRAQELNQQKIDTIYFGGGTPSLLSSDQLSKIFDTLNQFFDLSNVSEVTLEANPEDITQEKLELWKTHKINRLSIGIQSLNNFELQKMNRNHRAEESKTAISKSLQAGFDKITIDLIYGTPWKSDKEWLEELDWALKSGINHLSAYALTIEPQTLLAHQIEKNKEIVPPDEKTIVQFELLQQKIDEHGWDAYEISNYCLPNSEAIHNSNYWSGKNYLGIGPSAHSYNGNIRRWNVANNALYIHKIFENEIYFEEEILTPQNKANEFIMTQLRTKKGLNFKDILSVAPNWRKLNQKSIDRFVIQQYMIQTTEGISLTSKGKMISDYIISEFMI